MGINWLTLAGIAVVAAASAVTVVLLAAFALVGLSADSERRFDGLDHRARLGTHPTSGMVVAVLCLLAAGLIVCFGLYLIIG